MGAGLLSPVTSPARAALAACRDTALPWICRPANDQPFLERITRSTWPGPPDPTLAKIAELISIYRTHRVLIVGHTDASGEAAYNQMLSFLTVGHILPV